MPDKNFFELDCRLTKDMEIKVTKNGKTLASFGVCFNDSYQKDGQWIKKPNFWDCTAFGAAALLSFHKGELVHIEGALSLDTWERDGKKQSKTVLKVFKIESLGNGNHSSGGNSSPGPQGSPTPRSSPPQTPRPQPAYAEPGQGEFDSVPF